MERIRAFVEKAGITYPVAIDQSGKQWERFKFHYLPHMVLLDDEGRVRWSGNLYVHDAERVVNKVFGAGERTTVATTGDAAIDAAAQGGEEHCEGGVCVLR